MIHFDTDSFKMILVSSDYIPDKKHSKRSDIMGEIPGNNGYIQGGLDVDVSIKNDNVSNRVDITLGSAVWNNATIVATGAIYYKYGGNPITDDLVCYIEFEDEANSKNGSFRVTPSTLRIQN